MLPTGVNEYLAISIISISCETCFTRIYPVTKYLAETGAKRHALQYDEIEIENLHPLQTNQTPLFLLTR